MKKLTPRIGVLFKPFAKSLGGFAVSLLLLFATGCSSAPKSTAPQKQQDIELTQEFAAARASYARGAWPQAASLYKLALKRAELIDNPAEVATASFNYASALIQTGEYEAARAALSDAKAEAILAAASTADISALEARVALLQGKPDDAVMLAGAVLADKSAAPTDRLLATLVKGQSACGRNDIAAARQAAEQARALVGASTAPALAAGIAELDGSIALLDQKPAIAAERFDREATFLREGKLYGDMTRALARAGQAYSDADKPAESAMRYLRAARSAMAQSGIGSAPDWIKSAGIQAEKSGDADLIQRIAAFRKSVPQ